MMPRSKSVAIRADASRELGGGHVMRCLALAIELRARGARVAFLSRELQGNLFEVVRSYGFEQLAIAGEDDFSLSVDAENSKITLSENGPFDWLVVDHYGIDWRWESLLRPQVRALIVIDDLANRRHLCDLLIDQNYHGHGVSRYVHLVEPGCACLLGPRFALLRPEFIAARSQNKGERNGIHRILISFGAADNGNLTLSVLRTLAQIQGFRIDVIVGSANPNLASIQSVAAEMEGTDVWCQPSNVADLMASADFSIGAGGSMTWERFSTGLPTLAYSIAENQTATTQALAKDGYLIYGGKAADFDGRRLLNVIHGLIAMPECVSYLRNRCSGLVDGRGAARLADRMTALGLSLRRARLADCEALYRWRNSDSARRASKDSGPLLLEHHEAWFRKSLENEKRLIYIGEIENTPVGMVRFDCKDSATFVSINLAPEFTGRGLGARMLRLGIQRCLKELPGTAEILADVFSTNQRSLQVFTEAGFSPFMHTLRMRVA